MLLTCKRTQVSHNNALPVTRPFGRNDISGAVTLKFNARLQETDEADLKPVFTIDGITFAYIRVRMSQADEQRGSHHLFILASRTSHIRVTNLTT